MKTARLKILCSRDVPDGVFVGALDDQSRQYVAQSTMFYWSDQREGRACVEQMISTLYEAGYDAVLTQEIPFHYLPSI